MRQFWINKYRTNICIVLSKFQKHTNIFEIKGVSHENPHGFQGFFSKLHVCPHRREGGRKYPKIHPHGLWMFPPYVHEIIRLLKKFFYTGITNCYIPFGSSLLCLFPAACSSFPATKPVPPIRRSAKAGLGKQSTPCSKKRSNSNGYQKLSQMQ